MRDFIYLDVERVKSFVAQAEGGLPEMAEKLRDRDLEVKGEAGAKAEPGTLTRLLADVGGHADIGASLLLSKGERVSSTFHDALFDRLETLLEKSGSLFESGPRISESDWSAAVEDGTIGPTAFLRVHAEAHIWDYKRVRDMLGDFDKLAGAIVECGVAGQLNERAEELTSMTSSKRTAEEKRVRRAIEKEMDSGGVVGKLTESLSTVFDCLYGTPLIVRFLPVSEAPEIRLVCTLQEEWLREPTESLLFKYGMAPPHPWTVLGQVASVPPKGYTPRKLKGVFGNDVVDGFAGMFQGVAGFEQFGITVRFPEIGITPLAIYQEPSS